MLPNAPSRHVSRERPSLETCVLRIPDTSRATIGRCDMCGDFTSRNTTMAKCLQNDRTLVQPFPIPPETRKPSETRTSFGQATAPPFPQHEKTHDRPCLCWVRRFPGSSICYWRTTSLG